MGSPKARRRRSTASLQRKLLKRALHLMGLSSDLLDRLLYLLPDECGDDAPPTSALPGSLAYLPQMGLPGIRLEKVDGKTVRLIVPGTDLPPLLLSPREAELLGLLVEGALTREAKKSPDAGWRTYAYLARRLRPGQPTKCAHVIQIVCRLRKTGWLEHFVLTNRKLRAVRLKMYIPPDQIRAAATGSTV